MIKYFSFINEELRHRYTKSEKKIHHKLFSRMIGVPIYLIIISSKQNHPFSEIWTSVLVVSFHFVKIFSEILGFRINLWFWYYATLFVTHPIPVRMCHHFYVGLTPSSCDIPYKMLAFTLLGGWGVSKILWKQIQ